MSQVPATQGLNLEPLEDIAPDVQIPPTDLWSDEPPLESDLHREQIDLLIRLLKWYWRDRSDVYITGNLTVYYSDRLQVASSVRSAEIGNMLCTTTKGNGTRICRLDMRE